MSTHNYQQRRQKLMDLIGADGVAILPATQEFRRNGDVDFAYRQDSNLLYLSGFAEPSSVAVVMGSGDDPFQLFLRERDPAQELWLGSREGLEGARDHFGADASAPIGSFEAKLPELLKGRRKVYIVPGVDPAIDRAIDRVLAAMRARNRDGVVVPEAVMDLSATLSELRLFKEGSELDKMRHAAKASAAAHCAAMRVSRAGLNESDLQATVEYVFRREGCDALAYGSIVAGGNNACVLHYVQNNQPLEAEDLVLIDAGGEYQGYAADITRTFPVGGHFSSPQRDLYQAVLDAQLASIAKSRAGVRFAEVHDSSVRVLCDRLINLGLLEGSVDQAIEEGSYRRYYPHKTGHWLGIDVHDVGRYFESEGVSLLLAPGMCMTVEPGLYVRKDAEEAPEAFRGIGIRIEDDILITEGDPEILTSAVPKEVSEIEALMAEAAVLPL